MPVRRTKKFVPRTVESFTTDDMETFRPRYPVHVAPRLPSGHYTFGSDQLGQFFKIVELDATAVELDAIQRSVLEEIKVFWERADKYEALGFAHKRGFLLHGKPGTGKTTIVRSSIADVIERKGVSLWLNMNNHDEFHAAVNTVRQACPGAPILVTVEDVDDWQGGYDGALTNLMEGLGRMSGLLFLGTTNYYENISDRLAKRPGRFDRVIEVPFPDRACRVKYIRGVLRTASDVTVSSLADETADMSMAHIKEHLIQHEIYAPARAAAPIKLQAGAA